MGTFQIPRRRPPNDQKNLRSAAKQSKACQPRATQGLCRPEGPVPCAPEAASLRPWPEPDLMLPSASRRAGRCQSRATGSCLRRIGIASATLPEAEVSRFNA